MRKQHTLTFNEETWTIQLESTICSIYRNGIPTLWYLDTEVEKDETGWPQVIGFKLKNKDVGSSLIHCRVKDFTLTSMAEIIEIIKSH